MIWQFCRLERNDRTDRHSRSRLKKPSGRSMAVREVYGFGPELGAACLPERVARADGVAPSAEPSFWPEGVLAVADGGGVGWSPSCGTFPRSVRVVGSALLFTIMILLASTPFRTSS